MTAPHAVLLVPTEAGAALLAVGPSLRMYPGDLDIDSAARAGAALLGRGWRS